MINTLNGWYKNVKIYIPLSTQGGGLENVIALANEISTDYNEVGLSVNFVNFTVSDIQSLSAMVSPKIHIMCWTINDKEIYKQYLPYVNGITSDKISTYLLDIN